MAGGRSRHATDVYNRFAGLEKHKPRDRSGRGQTWAPGKSQRSKGATLFFLETALTMVLKSEKGLSLLKAFLKEVIGDSSSVLGWMDPKLFASLSIDKYYKIKLANTFSKFKLVPPEAKLGAIDEAVAKSLSTICRYSSLQKRNLYNLTIKFTPAQESMRQLVTMTTFGHFLSSPHGKTLMRESKGTELTTVIKQCAAAAMSQKKLRTGRKKWMVNFFSAVESLPLCVCLVDMRSDDNPYIYVNEEFEHMSGYTRDDSIGRSFTFLQGPGTTAEAKALIDTTIKTQKTGYICVTNHRRKDKSPFLKLMAMRPIWDSGRKKNLRYYAICQMDMTDAAKRGQLAVELYYLDAVFSLLPRTVL